MSTLKEMNKQTNSPNMVQQRNTNLPQNYMNLHTLHHSITKRMNGQALPINLTKALLDALKHTLRNMITIKT